MSTDPAALAEAAGAQGHQTPGGPASARSGGVRPPRDGEWPQQSLGDGMASRGRSEALQPGQGTSRGMPVTYRRVPRKVSFPGRDTPSQASRPQPAQVWSRGGFQAVTVTAEAASPP